MTSPPYPESSALHAKPSSTAARFLTRVSSASRSCSRATSTWQVSASSSPFEGLRHWARRVPNLLRVLGTGLRGFRLFCFGFGSSMVHFCAKSENPSFAETSSCQGPQVSPRLLFTETFVAEALPEPSTRCRYKRSPLGCFTEG